MSHSAKVGHPSPGDLLRALHGAKLALTEVESRSAWLEGIMLNVLRVEFARSA